LGFGGSSGGSSSGSGTTGYPNPVTSTFTITVGYTVLVKDSITITTGSIVLGTGSVLKIFDRRDYSTTTKTSNYTITSDDDVILVDASGSAITITLPDAADVEGYEFKIKAIDVSGGNVTIDTTSSQTIDGSTSDTLTSQYEVRRVVSDGSNWHIL
jgi:hypothetical protein